MDPVDMGSEPINTESVVVPTQEKIIEFQVTAKAEDRSPSQIRIRTVHEAGQRTVILNEANNTPEAFKEIWDRFLAMKATPQGIAFFQGLKIGLRRQPLKLTTSVVVEPVAEPVAEPVELVVK